MITTREDFLSAIRRAELTPQGLQVGPVIWVHGRDLRLKITDEPTRRKLINMVKLAASKYFTEGTIWEMPCLDGTSSLSPFGTSIHQTEPPF